MRNISRPEDNYIPLCRIIVRAGPLLLGPRWYNSSRRGVSGRVPLSHNLRCDFTTLSRSGTVSVESSCKQRRHFDYTRRKNRKSRWSYKFSRGVKWVHSRLSSGSPGKSGSGCLSSASRDLWGCRDPLRYYFTWRKNVRDEKSGKSSDRTIFSLEKNRVTISSNR